MLIQFIRNLALHIQAFLLSEKVFMENRIKKKLQNSKNVSWLSASNILGCKNAPIIFEIIIIFSF